MPATPDKLSKNLPRLAGFNALQMTLFPVAIITVGNVVVSGQLDADESSTVIAV